MHKQIIVFFLITVSFASSAQLPQQFDSLFQCYHKRGLFEGTALIADSSGIVYHRSFGLASRDYGISNDTSTIFRLGSIEKPFTAMLIMQLVEKGKLNLQGKIRDYLPGYKKETSEQVTIEHLLTHTSGIPNYTAISNVWEDSFQLSYKPGYILDRFCSGDLEFKPGSKYKYNNSGYFILAQIIERITGKPLELVLRDNILKPAGMNNTGLDSHLVPLRNKALGYYRLGGTYMNEPYIYVPNVAGAASIFSTAYDLYLWDRILYTNKLLPDKYLKLYTTPHFSIDPDYSYGYGWEFTKLGLSDNDTILTMEHSGAIRAFRAVIFRIPAEKKCIILLSNSANQSAYSLFENIMHQFRGRPWEVPKKLLADTLYAVMQATSVADAMLTYKNIKLKNSILYDCSSASLEFFGERLLMLRNYEAAAAVFQLAIEEDPTYTYGYFYLGKTYEKWGRRTDAIKMYQKAVLKDKNSRPGIDAAFQIRYLKTQK